MWSGMAMGASDEQGRKWGLSGSSLKLIAMVTMLIDHIGAVILLRLLTQHTLPEETIAWNDKFYHGFFWIFPWVRDEQALSMVYMTMRQIGRVSFPIFCFLLAEGFQKTRNVRNYALRLGAFAILSEIPFDLAISGVWVEYAYQNVYFTMFLGLLVMAAWEAVCRRSWFLNHSADKLTKAFLMFLCAALGAGMADFWKTDYGSIGVLCILTIYLFRRNKTAQAVAGAVSFCWEWPAPLAFLFVRLYNGERGMRVKYAFYLFYPLHLLLLYLICSGLGIGRMI